MMEKSRGRKISPEKKGALDWVDSLGKGLWWGGLAIQLLWHLRAITLALEHQDVGMYDPDDRSWSTLAVKGLGLAVALLPPADTLINSAVVASILSAWWNPQFVQVSRGFTRHLLGFTQWYAFQGLIVFFRVLFRRVLEMDGGQAQSRNTKLSAHLVMSVVMVMVSFGGEAAPLRICANLFRYILPQKGLSKSIPHPFLAPQTQRFRHRSNLGLLGRRERNQKPSQNC